MLVCIIFRRNWHFLAAFVSIYIHWHITMAIESIGSFSIMLRISDGEISVTRRKLSRSL